MYQIRSAARTDRYLCPAQQTDRIGEDHLFVGPHQSLWDIDDGNLRDIEITNHQNYSQSIAFPVRSDTLGQDWLWSTNRFNNLGQAQNNLINDDSALYQQLTRITLYRVTDNSILASLDDSLDRANIYCLVRNAPQNNDNEQAFMMAPRINDSHYVWSSTINAQYNNEQERDQIITYACWEITGGNRAGQLNSIPMNQEQPVNFVNPTPYNQRDNLVITQDERYDPITDTAVPDTTVVNDIYFQ